MNKKQLTVKKLDINNLADVMKLQEKIISGLHPDEQHFILHRTAEDYMKSLNGKSSNMLGVFDGDTLIAQTVYSLPLNGETRDMPEFKPEIENKDLVLYEAILVDPAYRGSSLMKRMLEYIESHAIDNGRTHAIIQIAVDNPASWINALHHGMAWKRKFPTNPHRCCTPPITMPRFTACISETTFTPRFPPCFTKCNI